MQSLLGLAAAHQNSAAQPPELAAPSASVSASSSSECEKDQDEDNCSASKENANTPAGLVGGLGAKGTAVELAPESVLVGCAGA